MIMIQKFHSIHEIDPEFISNIEVLLEEEIASFATLLQRHDSAPASDVFTYFLFFGPTQNAPIGFAQLCLRQIPTHLLLPWYKKLCFWKKDHQHWKEVIWQIGDGAAGMSVFDPRFARTGKEKVQELIREYEERSDIKAQRFFYPKGIQDFQMSWTEEDQHKLSTECYVLEPLAKASKNYEDYISHLKPDIRKQIKSHWKKLHVNLGIKLGDYPSPATTPNTLPIPREQLEVWESWGAQVLTFEQDLRILGCILVLKGKNGNFFFEPFPFEPQESALVPDELYTQYALLKFFEMPESRKCHMMKFGAKLVFDDQADLQFFQEQGFQMKTIIQSFVSRMPELTHPI